VSVLAPAYRPRRPQDTVLHKVVREHLETFLAHARESYDAPLPKYVQGELHGYLRCGIFDHGFTRAHCDACGHDLLVAFSCKARGLCPSCAGRRMANTAAHLVDRVFPSVPVRQWVLSLPFDVRARAAFDPRFLTALVRAFASALDARHGRLARSIGLEKTQFAAVTFVQRFGSSLNLNVHLHVAVVDGVFSRDESGAICFTPAPPPTYVEMLAVLDRVRARVAKLAPPSATPPQPPLEACARVALSRGDVRATTAELGEDADPIDPPARDGAAVDQAGWNLEASVRIAADDDFGREHLLRYCARPPLSLARLVELPNRKIGYRIKKLRNGRSKLRIMTPLELLARLAALVPPPRHPLVRFHGAFAPRSSWRRDVVPKPRAPIEPKKHAHHPKPTTPEMPSPTPPRPSAPAAAPPAPRGRDPKPPPSAALVPATERLTPNVLGLRHWDRLESGALAATSPRIDWATLMRRTFDVDVLECPKCNGKLRILAVVETDAHAAQILDELAIERTPPPPRARDPSTLEAAPTDAAP
jgi:hypothetical protein